MSSINIAVHGALGKMGQEVLRAVASAPDMNPVGAADGMAKPGQISLPDGSDSVPISDNITDVLSGVDVVVDFSSADGAMCVIRAAAAYKVNVVVGSTGLSVSDYQEAEELANEHSVGIIIAPNFAMGAVIMIHLAKIASQFFDYADLTEMHHEAKIDAPSGTALAIAMAAVEGKGGEFTNVRAEKELIAGPRGGDFQGISVHSARMAGLVAHHQLVFGALGQTLTIRHDSMNRESFMPGVTMAIREVINREGLTVGLENIMGLV